MSLHFLAWPEPVASVVVTEKKHTHTNAHKSQSTISVILCFLMRVSTSASLTSHTRSSCYLRSFLVFIVIMLALCLYVQKIADRKKNPLT